MDNLTTLYIIHRQVLEAALSLELPICLPHTSGLGYRWLQSSELTPDSSFPFLAPEKILLQHRTRSMEGTVRVLLVLPLLHLGLHVPPAEATGCDAAKKIALEKVPPATAIDIPKRFGHNGVQELYISAFRRFGSLWLSNDIPKDDQPAARWCGRILDDGVVLDPRRTCTGHWPSLAVEAIRAATGVRGARDRGPGGIQSED